MEQKGKNEERLNELLGMIENIAALDFSKILAISEKNDMIDAIALGLNMLAEELNDQVIAKAKVDEINTRLEKFAYTTAHDLKSPLNSATALIALIRKSVAANDLEDVLFLLDKLELNNEKMRRLVEGILEYSKTYSMNMSGEAVDLNEVMNEVIEIDNVKELAEIYVENSLPVVCFHKTAAIQVFRNLVDNSIKYSDKEKCKIQLSATELNDGFRIEFRDNGMGIEAEFLNKVFDLYTRFHPDESATSVGIGLATVKNLIESAGGNIWVESEIGEGTAFIFTLKKPLNDKA